MLKLKINWGGGSASASVRVTMPRAWGSKVPTLCKKEILLLGKPLNCVLTVFMIGIGKGVFPEEEGEKIGGGGGGMFCVV